MPNRRTLPGRRPSETLELRHANLAPFAVTIGRYPDGRVGEVFVSNAKSGAEIEAVARDGAVLLSIALQHGVPLETMAGAITRDLAGRPMSIVGCVLDLITTLNREER